MSMIEFYDGGMFARLDQLPGAIQAKAIRPAAQAGAQVLYDEVRARVPVSRKGHWFYGTTARDAPKGQKKQHAYWFDAGSLRKAIYQKHVPEQAVDGIHVYHISWRKTGPDAVPYGFMVEYGTARSPAHPFLRSAYEAKKQAALDAADKVLGQKLDEVLNGL